ncbi:unnamed protein product [Dovyalis caffra]|uniref:Uncharacterized protein n=1 Tax=Dovyalis caffra TaxID=77055 RepID=A0AAV1SK39_9ROSI|nr:unnamed protein product [Dovyalis caffra]
MLKARHSHHRVNYPLPHEFFELGGSYDELAEGVYNKVKDATFNGALHAFSQREKKRGATTTSHDHHPTMFGHMVGRGGSFGAPLSASTDSVGHDDQ